MFLWTHKMQNWRNWEKFPLRVRSDLPWSRKVVNAVYNFFSKQFSLTLFRWHKECGFDNAAEQLSPKVRKFFPQIRKSLKNQKKISHPRFFLELIVWHVDCNFGNPSEKFKRKMKLSQSKYKKDKKICKIFTKIVSLFVDWTRKYSFGNCADVFQQEVRRLFIQIPELV